MISAELMKMSIDELDLPTRAYNALMKAGKRTVGDVIQTSEEQFIKTRGIGLKTLRAIEECLGKLNICLKFDDSPYHCFMSDLDLPEEIMRPLREAKIPTLGDLKYYLANKGSISSIGLTEEEFKLIKECVGFYGFEIGD